MTGSGGEIVPRLPFELSVATTFSQRTLARLPSRGAGIASPWGRGSFVRAEAHPSSPINLGGRLDKFGEQSVPKLKNGWLTFDDEILNLPTGWRAKVNPEGFSFEKPTCSERAQTLGLLAVGPIEAPVRDAASRWWFPGLHSAWLVESLHSCPPGEEVVHPRLTGDPPGWPSSGVPENAMSQLLGGELRFEEDSSWQFWRDRFAIHSFAPDGSKRFTSTFASIWAMGPSGRFEVSPSASVLG